MENKINLTINGEVKEPIQIVVREGEAASIIEPVQVDISGTIESARLYANKIEDKKKAVVTFSLDKKTIELNSDPTNIYRHIVKGELKTNPDLIAFGINKGNKFNSDQLQNFIKTHAHCIKDINEAKNLIKSLQNFMVKFEQEVTKTDDRKGTTEDSVKNSIKYHKGELQNILALSMPLYVGTDKVDFTVEIEIDRDGTTPVFSFYSLDLEVQLKETSEHLINTELEDLRKDFTCIQLL